MTAPCRLDERKDQEHSRRAPAQGLNEAQRRDDAPEHQDEEAQA
ncbi:hypothetical protein [Brevundimonas diminuta]